MKAIILIALTLAGCCTTKPPIVLPPEIIKVPTFVPLPAECAQIQIVAALPGTTAEQLLAQQQAALLAYEAQVARCFKP